MEGQPDKPRMTSINYFRQAIKTHKKVVSVKLETDQIYRVSREHPLEAVTVYLTDLYTVGIADVIEITERCNQVNCIVTISNWNGYTKKAKDYCSERDIGLFLMDEFMGALWHQKFWTYFKKDANGHPQRSYKTESA